ncbi:MAG: hypothetical protein AAGI10_13700 [Pseudomonadota bacterium]
MFNKIAIAATVVALSAGAAAAKDQFGILGGAEMGDLFYDVNIATVSGAGSVQIETMKGVVLGMAALEEGANTNVRVPLMFPANNEDLLAKLVVDGEIVDIEMIQVR